MIPSPTFFRANLALWSALELLLGPTAELVTLLPCKIHLLHITIVLRNDSLLYRIRADDTSKWQIFPFVVISQGTHLLSFYTFPICFKYQTSIKWSKLSPWATSQVVVRGSASMILSVGHCQLPMAGRYASHFQGSHLLCKTSWITTALYVC